MPRKTRFPDRRRHDVEPASMRPRPDAAENVGGALKRVVDTAALQ